jgi:hypothetical protein
MVVRLKGCKAARRNIYVPRRNIYNYQEYIYIIYIYIYVPYRNIYTNKPHKHIAPVKVVVVVARR